MANEPHDCADESACGETIDFRFVDDGDGLRILATVEIGVHPTTSLDAKDHFLRLHPLRPGARIVYADWPGSAAPTMAPDGSGDACEVPQ